MEGKRVLIAVVLCVGILLGWPLVQRFIWPPDKAANPALTGTPATGAVAGATGAAGAGAAGAGAAAGAAGAAAGTGVAAGVTGTAGAAGAAAPVAAIVPAERAPEQLRWLETPELRMGISTRGGALVKWELKNPQWASKPAAGAAGVPIDLASAPSEFDRAFRLLFDTAPFAFPAGADDWEPRTPAGKTDEVVMRWTDPAGKGWVEKRFSLDPLAFHVRLEVTVHNATALPAEVKSGIYITAWQDPTKAQERGFFHPVADTNSAVCMVNDGVDRAILKNALKGMSTPGVVRWVGVDRQYFLLGVIPDPNPATGNCEWGATPTGLITAALKFQAQTAPPGGDVKWSMWLYGGPKVSETLSLKNVELERAIDYGWLGFLCRPMISLMKVFHGWFGNWGLAIILLTFCVRAATFYWNQKAYKSMQDMARLKPEMDRLKAKYGEDKERLNTEIAALMRNNKVNPLGGCLPMLLPMPIFFALYYTIFYSAEMFKAPFMGWIHDLSTADPFYVFPVLTGITMVISGLLTPVTTDSAQTKMIRYVMPVVFTGMMLFLPSALSIYYFVNTLLGIVQQYVVRRRYGSIGVSGGAAGPEALKKPAEIKGAKDVVGAAEKNVEDVQKKAEVWFAALSRDPAAAAAGTSSPLPTYVAALRPLLDKGDAEVRARAARLLGAARDVLSVPRLVELLDAGPVERRAAIDALGKIGDVSARGPLRSSMKLTRIWEYPSIISALTAIEQRQRAGAGAAAAAGKAS